MSTLRNSLYGFQVRDTDNRRSENRKAYDIKALWQRHHEIVNLSAQGFSNVQIAKIMNMAEVTISNTLNSSLGEEKLSELRAVRDGDVKETVAKIGILTNKAIEVYHNIFDDESGECTLKDKKEVADKVLLELSGLRVPTKIQSHSLHTVLTPTEIEEFKRRGLAAARESGLIIEGEIIPEKVGE